jgi:hypothetical protein
MAAAGGAAAMVDALRSDVTRNSQHHAFVVVPRGMHVGWTSCFQATKHDPSGVMCAKAAAARCSSRQVSSLSQNGCLLILHGHAM